LAFDWQSAGASLQTTDMHIHFISGLPRAGSTLLSALLRQNPRFCAGVASPVALLVGNLLRSMSGVTEFVPFFTDARRSAIIKALFSAYYAIEPPYGVVFDSNRTWTARTALLGELFPQARIICCVREVSWILDSIERLVRLNSLQPSKLFNYQAGSSVYARIEMLMEPEKGLVGLAWNGLREAWFSEHARRQLVLIRYESLARNAKEVLRSVYQLLDEPCFEHDLENVSFDEPDYDAELGMPGLHKVRPRVEFVARPSCLPPDIFAKYADVNFWLNPKLNLRGVTIL
jgi:sulfotransferase